MLIMIDLPFVLLISVLTDAIKKTLGGSKVYPKCILRNTNNFDCFLKVFPLQWNFSFRTHIYSRDTSIQIVCYTAVFSVVTQRWGGALRDDSKNDCVADYYSEDTKFGPGKMFT